MFSKMWCVGIFALGIMVQDQATACMSVADVPEAILITPQSKELTEVAKGLNQDKIALADIPEAILATPLAKGLTEVAKGLDQDKIALIEEIVRLVRPHLSQEEMSKLLLLLQRLAKKVTVPTLIEIHRKLKTDIVKFGILVAFFGTRKPQSTQESDDTILAKIQKNVCVFLSKTKFTSLDPKQQNFILNNAEELSKIISSALKQHLPDCLHDLSETLETLKGLEQAATLHEVITAFVKKHNVELPS